MINIDMILKSKSILSHFFINIKYFFAIIFSFFYDSFNHSLKSVVNHLSDDKIKILKKIKTS